MELPFNTRFKKKEPSFSNKCSNILQTKYALTDLKQTTIRPYLYIAFK